MSIVPEQNGDICHCCWPTYSIIIVEEKRKGGEKKPPRKEKGYRVFLTSIKQVGQNL